MAKSKHTLAKSQVVDFQKTVLTYYKKHGRHTLPWRKTIDPYHILVSEIMLQQTQVDRVVPKYEMFIKKYSTARKLAAAPLSDVLRLWQGLGYNRRAKMLHMAAKEIVQVHGGVVPHDYVALTSLSGIGPYTARAVQAFAFNLPGAVVETNIRAVYLHHFFTNRTNVPDTEIVPYIDATLPSKNPREWYSALMDYGSHIKSITQNPSRRSLHYVRQKPFKGSDREIRGAILKLLARKNTTLSELPFDFNRVKKQAEALVREGLIVRKGKVFILSP